MLYDDVYEDDKEILNQDEQELHETSRNGDLNMVKELIRNKINVNALDEKLRSPLHLAAGQGHVDVIKTLLSAGAKIEDGDIYGMNALLWAAWFGKVEVMKELLQAGADSSVVNKQGLTIVHCAATRGHMDVLQYLVREVFKEEGFDDEDTFLDSVGGKVSDILGGAGRFMNLGKKFGSNQNTFFKEKVRPDSSKLETKAGKSSESEFSLDLAMRKISTALFTSLSSLVDEEPEMETIKEDKRVESQDNIRVRPEYSHFETRTNPEGKKTALHLAAEQGHMEALEYLIKAKCNKNAVTGDGSTAVHLAAGSGRREIVLKLLEKKMDINAKNKEGKTPLHIAAEAGQASMVELLLANEARGNVTAAKEMAAIHLAARKNNTEVINAIAKFNTDLDVPCEGGNSALHLGAALGNLDAVEALVFAGANVNMVNSKNRTPLHEVTENGFTDIVEFLLVEGASVDVVDKNGKTALLMAIRAENITITDMIIKAERYYEGVRQGRINGAKKVTSFRNERTPQQKQMKPFCYDLAMKELEEDDLRRLFFHWRFKELHVKAIQSQYIGNKSWHEHAYRMLLIWLHGCDENPLKELYETLVTAGRKKLADKLRMRANKLAKQNNGNCVIS
ncbi:uncharacterized protein [Apostichopus japonicus]|uniref:uncharacterized protein isoform X2 n=1 Tax=Stichopus japonicus TaxID=307972 RepID=UPI003AB60C86